MSARFTRRDDGVLLSKDHTLGVLNECLSRVTADQLQAYVMQFTIDDNEDLKGLLVLNFGKLWEGFEALHALNQANEVDTRVVDIEDEAEVWAEDDQFEEGDIMDYQKLAKYADLQMQTGEKAERRRRRSLRRQASLQAMQKAEEINLGGIADFAAGMGDAIAALNAESKAPPPAVVEKRERKKKREGETEEERKARHEQKKKEKAEREGETEEERKARHEQKKKEKAERKAAAGEGGETGEGGEAKPEKKKRRPKEEGAADGEGEKKKKSSKKAPATEGEGGEKKAPAKKAKKAAGGSGGGAGGADGAGGAGEGEGGEGGEGGVGVGGDGEGVGAGGEAGEGGDADGGVGEGGADDEEAGEDAGGDAGDDAGADADDDASSYFSSAYTDSAYSEESEHTLSESESVAESIASMKRVRIGGVVVNQFLTEQPYELKRPVPVEEITSDVESEGEDDIFGILRKMKNKTKRLVQRQDHLKKDLTGGRFLSRSVHYAYTEERTKDYE